MILFFLKSLLLIVFLAAGRDAVLMLSTRELFYTNILCPSNRVSSPWVAGIAPSKNGAYSVALSGGYDDDVDLGYAL
jgi:hypothetical protein